MPASCSELMLAAVRIACAEIVSEIGYGYATESALDTMSEVVAKYIINVALGAKSNAELARRTSITIWDAINSIENLGIALPVLLQFRKISNDLPFIFDPLPFPQTRKIILCAPVGSQIPQQSESLNEDVSTSAQEAPFALPEIPRHLPSLPAPHTYKFTPVFQKANIDPNSRRKMIIKQKRQVESSLVKLNRSMQQQDSNANRPH